MPWDNQWELLCLSETFCPQGAWWELENSVSGKGLLSFFMTILIWTSPNPFVHYIDFIIFTDNMLMVISLLIYFFIRQHGDRVVALQSKCCGFYPQLGPFCVKFAWFAWVGFLLVFGLCPTLQKHAYQDVICWLMCAHEWLLMSVWAWDKLVTCPGWRRTPALNEPAQDQTGKT